MGGKPSGHELGYALQQDLYIEQGKAFGLISPLKVFEDYIIIMRLGEKQKSHCRLRCGVDA